MRRSPTLLNGYRTLLNEADGIYRNGGDQLILNTEEPADGYTASFDIELYTE